MLFYMIDMWFSHSFYMILIGFVHDFDIFVIFGKLILHIFYNIHIFFKDHFARPPAQNFG